MESFDWNFNPSLNRQQVLQLASGDYLRHHRNILICGPSGTGKSHLAAALSHEACRQGFEVLFVSTHKMLQHLHGGRADDTVERRLATYVRPDLLVLDDFGLKPLTAPAPSDLYDVINERYEVGSIVVTSNRAPSEWPELFGDPLLASAGLDRLAHHAETLLLTGRSYRAQGPAPEPFGLSERNETRRPQSQKEVRSSTAKPLERRRLGSEITSSDQLSTIAGDRWV